MVKCIKASHALLDPFFITPLAQFDLPDSKRAQDPSPSSKVGRNFLDIKRDSETKCSRQFYFIEKRSIFKLFYILGKLEFLNLK